MVKINFDKRVELVFGLLYCINKDYNFSDIVDQYFTTNKSSYYDEFYLLYKNHADNELIEYMKLIIN